MPRWRRIQTSPKPRQAGRPKFKPRRRGRQGPPGDACASRTVELLVEDGRLIIAPERRVRDGWKEAFAVAGSSKNGGVQLDAGPANAFGHEEWAW
jgi:hypothetical protein